METPHGMESQPSQHRRSAGHTLARASQGKRSGDHPVSAQCTAAPRESQSRSFRLSLSEGLHLHIHTPRTFTHAVPPTAPLPARNPLEGNRFCYFKVPGTEANAGTSVTSQPSGLLLPFCVPSKVSWHKQAGGTPRAASSPPAHPTGSDANTPPQAHTLAHTHTPRQPTAPAARSQWASLRTIYKAPK